MVCVLYAIAIGLVVLAGVVHLAGGMAPETNPADWSAWSPWAASGINLTNWSFFGLVVLALLGVEVPLNMGVEIKDERSITRYLLWGSLAVIVAYLLATWAVMVTVPAADGESAQVTALATAVGTTMAGWLGKLVAIAAHGGVLGVWREGAQPVFYSLPEDAHPVLAQEWTAMAMTDGKVIDVIARGDETFVIVRIPAT